MQDRRGFTLIELMIVMAIIGILAAIAVPNYLKFISKSRRTEMKTNLEAIYKVEWSYYGEHDFFSNDFNLIRWRPEGSIFFYTYSLGGGVLGKDVAQNPQPAAAAPFANDNAFSVYAWGNIDSDTDVDIWHSDENRLLTNDADDIAS